MKGKYHELLFRQTVVSKIDIGTYKDDIIAVVINGKIPCQNLN